MDHQPPRPSSPDILSGIRAHDVAQPAQPVYDYVPDTDARPSSSLEIDHQIPFLILRDPATDVGDSTVRHDVQHTDDPQQDLSQVLEPSNLALFDRLNETEPVNHRLLGRVLTNSNGSAVGHHATSSHSASDSSVDLGESWGAVGLASGLNNSNPLLFVGAWDQGRDTQGEVDAGSTSNA
ncbi:hypothetical protein HJFPF1_00903 [Paramyrothecium foliicola]|nr:hypothetical protein HJFPF1_00903 [Paramyrothecium foliicola]